MNETNYISELNGYKIKDKELQEKLNLTQMGTPTVISSFGTISSSSLRYAVNADGSIGKLYGFMRITTAEPISSDYVTIVIDTPFRPSESFNIDGYGIAMVYESTEFTGMQPIAINFNISGRVTLTFANNSNITFRSVYLPAIMIFAKNFGDE